MEGDMGKTRPHESMSVSEAADFLGLTEDAVRKRIHRGKISYERDHEGRYLVYPTQEDIRHTADTNYVQSESSALISEMRAQLERLEDQLEKADERDRENRRLLAAALERIPPQLEAPSEPRESPETATEGEAEPRPGGGQEGAQRPWWRRVFGGDGP
jgi:excisionase family DNA binding protein